MRQPIKTHRYVPMADPRVPPYPPIELISDDGENTESEWHWPTMALLIECVRRHFAECDDFFAGGNMFIYFNEQQARNRDFRGPDFFFVWDRPLLPLRSWWAVWEEDGKFPNVIFELQSPTTIDDDLGVKKDVYQDIFKTPEYFYYDPTKKSLLGWKLENDVYVPLEPNDEGRLWSEELGLWVGKWRGEVDRRPGTYPRFFTPDGEVVPNADEAVKALKRETLAIQKQAIVERRQQEAESRRADEQTRRAEAAERELECLKKLLADRGIPPS